MIPCSPDPPIPWTGFPAKRRFCSNATCLFYALKLNRSQNISVNDASSSKVKIFFSCPFPPSAINTTKAQKARSRKP